MLRNTLQAAERQRALVVLPGTVYNYGPDAFPLIAEEAAQQPVTRKGASGGDGAGAGGLRAARRPGVDCPGGRFFWPARRK